MALLKDNLFTIKCSNLHVSVLQFITSSAMISATSQELVLTSQIPSPRNPISSGGCERSTEQSDEPYPASHIHTPV